MAYNDPAVEGYSRLVSRTARNGGTESYTYNARGLRTGTTDALGNAMAVTYDTADRPATMTDARGNVTTFQYDERGNRTRTTYADASTVTATYDAFGNQTSQTNELGNTWLTTYDEFHRVTSRRDPLARTTLFAYTLPGGICGCTHTNGKPTAITLPSGRQTTVAYDLIWRKTSETVGAGSGEAATTQYGYDAADNLLTVTDPRGKVWTSTFDTRDRKLSATDPLGNKTQWTYDTESNRLTEKRPDNGVTSNSYDARNRLAATTDPKGQTTSFGYDSADNLTSLTDARGSVTAWSYDTLRRPTRKTYADGSHEDSTYDGTGNLVTYRTTANQTRTGAYDTRNRQTGYTWSDGTPGVTMSYDAAGRMLTMTNSVSALSYSYDAANQLTAETQDINSPIDLPTRTLSYSYDGDGNRAGTTYPDGMAISYGYTARNQMNSVTADGPPPLATYGYDLTGNRTFKTLENGTATAYTYDDASRLLSINHTKAGASFQRFDYSLNNVGNRTARTETGSAGAPPAVDTYGYDPTDQVTQVKYNFNAGTGTQARKVDYAYDPAGNRTSVTDTTANAGTATPYSANNLNQYTSIDGLNAPAYDANGNLIAVQYKLTEALWSYTYDAQNRLTSGTNGTTSFTFAYDPRNRCVTRTIAGTTKTNTYDDWSLIEERDPTGAQIAKYIHGPVLDEILYATVTTAGQQVVTYHHHDGLGSVTALSDQTGTVLERITYDIYGAPTLSDPTGQPLTTSIVGNRFLFTGREWLAELRLNDYRNRYYLSDIGRWLHRDPLKRGELLAEGTNLYAYVGNRATSLWDPFGLAGGTSKMGEGALRSKACCEKKGGTWGEAWQDPNYGDYSSAGDCATKCAREVMSAAGPVGAITAAVLHSLKLSRPGAIGAGVVMAAALLQCYTECSQTYCIMP